MKVRPPAVAGSFYPAERAALEGQIRSLLAEARARGAAGPPPKALVAPHAGTVYSGPIAASAYARVEELRERIRRVILLGPAHRVALRGLAAHGADAFRTPLGEVPLDRATIEALLALEQVRQVDRAHEGEHSLELHLPFLQVCLRDFALVPLVVGDATADEVAEVLDACWGGDETLIVVSSDLSHFLDYDSARRCDARTSRLIERLAWQELEDEQACGARPLRGLLLAAQRRSLACAAVDVRSSGDTAGPRERVVGYGSYLFC